MLTSKWESALCLTTVSSMKYGIEELSPGESYLI